MIDALCDRGHTPYRQIGHRAVSYVMDRCGIAYTQDEVRWLVGEIEKLKPFPDVVAALEKLRVRGIQAGDPVERRPRHAQGRRAAHRLCVRSRHLGAGGRLFQAALEDLRQGRGDHRRGSLEHACSSPITPSTASAPNRTACAPPSSTGASGHSARPRTSPISSSPTSPSWPPRYRQLHRRLNAQALQIRDSVLIARVHRQRPAVVGDRSIAVAFSLERDASAIQRRDVSWVELQDLVEVGDRLIQVVLLGVSHAPYSPRVRIFRVQADGPVQVRNRLVVIVLVVIGHAAIAPREYARCIEPDCLIVVGNRPIKIALQCVGETTIVEGCRVGRIEPDRLRVVDNRVVVIALVVVGEPSVVMSQKIGGSELDRPVQVCESVVIMTSTRCGHSLG